MRRTAAEALFTGRSGRPYFSYRRHMQCEVGDCASDGPQTLEDETVTGVNADNDDDSIVGRARETFDVFLDLIVERADELGLTAAEVLARFEGTEMFDVVVTAFLNAVLERQPEFAREDREYHRGFSERLRGDFGPALDAFLVFVSLCIESASNVYGRGTGQVDSTGEVLLDLHARACLVSQEIHTLLSNGYPFGALAAWRTVHELSVVAAVLEQHGRENGADLTNRWVACDDVIRLKDAEIYQERHERLGYEPLSETDLQEMRDRVDLAVKTYGPSIANTSGYGWAVEICKPKSANFRTLEELAGRDHLRGHYRWASHRVHGDSRGNEHNWITRGGQSARLAGPTNLGLVDAADLTLSSLLISTNCVLTGVRDDCEAEPEEVVMMLALGRMQERVTQAFVDGEARVEAAEAALLAEQAARKAGSAASQAAEPSRDDD